MTPAELAAMPVSTPWQCQEQDLAAAHAVELIAIACEGNGDAYQELIHAVENIRASVARDRERDAIAAANEQMRFNDARRKWA